MKKVLASSLALSLLLTASIASAINLDSQDTKNLSCPKFNDIKPVNIGIAVKDEEAMVGEKNSYTSVNLKNYNTPALWAFTISNIDANDRTEAFEKAKTALSSVSGEPELKFSSKDKIHVCEYTVDGKGKNDKPLKARAFLVF